MIQNKCKKFEKIPKKSEKKIFKKSSYTETFFIKTVFGKKRFMIKAYYEYKLKKLFCEIVILLNYHFIKTFFVKTSVIKHL